MPRTLPELLNEPAVKELRAMLQSVTPNVRNVILQKYFCPLLSTPQEGPAWLTTDAEQYREEMRNAAYGIED